MSLSHTDEPYSWGSHDVAKLLGFTVKAVYKLLTLGKLPPPLKVGSHLRWRPSTIRAFTARLEAEAQARHQAKGGVYGV
jgi:predicted DNA-binding transcriptional regulator AlpA